MYKHAARGLLLEIVGLILAISSTSLFAGMDMQSILSKAGIGNMAKPSLLSDVTVTADHMGADRKTGESTLDGNVLVHFSDVTLSCDAARYNANTGDLHAEGNVVIASTSGGSWKGESIDFNCKTGEGLVGTGILKLGTFTVLADSYARDDDGCINAMNATVTTCTNEMERWHWSITGKARYKDKEFIEMKNAVGRFLGVPLIWMPYYYRDLNTDYGWRFMPGYTSKWGAYLKSGYVYPIAGSMEEGALLYGKSVLDVRSNYGVAVGQELSWRTEAFNQQGRLSAYYANHHDNQDAEDANWQSAYNKHRWDIGLTERLEFSPRDTFTLMGEVVSDSQFREDYNEIAVRAASQPTSLANYEHRENRWVSSLSVGGPINSFYAGVRTLPEFRFDIMPQELWGISKLYYESQTTAGYYERQPAKYDESWSETYRYQTGNWAYYDTGRVDTRHMLRRPFTLAEGVTFTPRAGWRGTFYTDSLNDSSDFRSLFEIGARLQARYWQDFDTLRHTIVPYIDATYVPASEEGENDQNFAFDRIDRSYEWRDRYGADGIAPTHRYAGVRFGLKNVFQRREESGLRKILDFDLYGIYVAQSQDEYIRWSHRDQMSKRGKWLESPIKKRVKDETGLRVVGLSGTYKPFSKFEIQNDIQFDPEESRLAIWDIHGKYTLDTVKLYAGFLARHHEVYDYYWDDMVEDRIIYGGFVHQLCDTFTWSLYARYNMKDTDLEEIGGFLQYNLDCISFKLNTGYLPKYTSEDGYKHDSDIRISLGVWLRAFPKNESEDWMTWGNLSNDKALGL